MQLLRLACGAVACETGVPRLSARRLSTYTYAFGFALGKDGASLSISVEYSLVIALVKPRKPGH
jgi:hypothetical protein